MVRQPSLSGPPVLPSSTHSQPCMYSSHMAPSSHPYLAWSLNHLQRQKSYDATFCSHEGLSWQLSLREHLRECCS